MEINELTKRLLSEGYTKETPPEWVKPWSDFYGGWEYPRSMLNDMVFETPCGLLIKGSEIGNGHMSYMGVNWMVENDNYTVTCPKFDGKPCGFNHELLKNHHFGHRDILTHCACHLTDKSYNYEHSFEKAHADAWVEADMLFIEFANKLNGRACKHRSLYNRTTKKWRMHYDPYDCARERMPCQYCSVLQSQFSPKKGNVFYDVKRTWIEKSNGLWPNVEKTSITKGVKLLERPVSVTLCEAIVKHSKGRIIDWYKLNRHSELYFDPSLKYELFNFRCEVRASRDLLQDLADAQAGIDVHHAAVDAKIAAEQKRQRRQLAKQKRNRRIEKKIVQLGYDGLEAVDRIRADKWLEPDRILELEQQKANELDKPVFKQLQLF